MENCTVQEMPKETGFLLSAAEFELVDIIFLESEDGLHVYTQSRGTITNCTFSQSKNTLKITDYSTVTIRGKVYFSNNIQGEDGFSAMLLEDSTVSFEGHTVFEKTKGGKFGAVISSNTTMHFYGEVDFIGNEGFYGGALSMFKLILNYVYPHYSNTDFHGESCFEKWRGYNMWRLRAILDLHNHFITTEV